MDVGLWILLDSLRVLRVFSFSVSDSLFLSISPGTSGLSLDFPSISDSLPLLFCLVEKRKGEKSGSERKKEGRREMREGEKGIIFNFF
jgi:hypothetical protein